MRLDPAPLCLRNDGGTLGYDWNGFRDVVSCYVCGDKYSVELLEQTIKSTWEALRLGYQPTVRKSWGGVARISMTFTDAGPLWHEDYSRELQPYSIGFVGLERIGDVLFQCRATSAETGMPCLLVAGHDEVSAYLTSGRRFAHESGDGPFGNIVADPHGHG